MSWRRPSPPPAGWRARPSCARSSSGSRVTCSANSGRWRRPRRPIVLQRWGVRRLIVAAAMLGAAVVAAVSPPPRTARRSTRDRRPVLRHRPLHDLVRAGGAVRRLLPCIAALPSGWTVAGADIASGRSVFWLDSDQAGPRALTVSLTAGCGTSGAVRSRRPARSGAFRAPAEPAAAVHADADLHLRRRMRHLPVQLRPGRGPPAGHPGRHRGRVRAEIRSGPLRPADRGPGALRPGSRVLYGPGQLCPLPAAARRLSVGWGNGMGASRSAGELRGELTEFVGRRAELARVRDAWRVRGWSR